MSDAALRIRPARLQGSVRVSGAKNSALRLQAASLLTADTVRLGNFPHGLDDAQVHNDMLAALGKRCHAAGDVLVIEETGIPSSELVWDGRSIRNTLLILGALVARTGAGSVPLPGGCKLGERKHDLHELVLTSLGAEVWEEAPGRLCAQAPSAGLRGADIHLPLRSTGATENAILCGSLASGTTTVWNPHIRPEILDLIDCLRGMGADIAVHGQERVVINGRDGLHGAEHRVIPDNMEAITWAIAAGVSGGEIEIHDFPWQHLEVPLVYLREAGLQLYRGDHGKVLVRGGVCYPIEISTGPYPGINSDMQPLFAIYGQRSRGETRIIDLRFPGRYGYAQELARLGVRQRVQGDMLIIDGGDQLHGSEVRALDLRAGAALVLAGLVASDETVIHNAGQIHRGYENLGAKLRGLGAHVETDAG